MSTTANPIRKADVKVGTTYTAKVSDRIVPVRIDTVLPGGRGWTGTNQDTGRQVRVRSAARLRGVHNHNMNGADMATSTPSTPTEGGVAPLETLKAAQPETPKTIAAAEASETDGLKPRKARAPRKPKATAETSKAAKRSTYPVEISEAVKLAKQARGTTNGAPGAKQHVALRAAITQEIGEQPTKATLLKWLGISQRDLLAAASGGMPTADLRKVETFKKVQALDALQDPTIRPWVGGRNGASILVAWVEQIKAR